MTWKPISQDALRDLINSAESRMTPEQLRCWEAIRCEPGKWRQVPYGSEGGGFWAVGILGRLVVWYNDIEEGFNYSTYTTFGTIDEYRCDQDALELTVQRLLSYVEPGPPR